MTKTTLIIIPAYNETNTIEAVIQQALEYCPNVLVIDDASTDDTLDKIKQFPVQLIHHNVNQGKGASLLDGMQHAIATGFEQVISMDADNQHSAADIPQLLQAHQQHPNRIIIASRVLQQEQSPAGRLFANRFANFWVSWAAGHHVIDSQSGFRLYPTTLLKQLSMACSKQQSFVFENQIIILAAALGYQTFPIAVAAHYPKERRASYYRPGKDTWLITKMIGAYLLRHWLYLPGLWRSLTQRQGKIN